MTVTLLYMGSWTLCNTASLLQLAFATAVSPRGTRGAVVAKTVLHRDVDGSHAFVYLAFLIQSRQGGCFLL